MTSGLDLWRAIDPEARLLSGSVDRLRTAVRGVARTRAGPPHLPEDAEGQLLVVDRALLGADASLDRLVGILEEAGLQPVAVMLAALPQQAPAPDRAGDLLPILGSSLPSGTLVEVATRHLEHADEEVMRIAAEVRLAAAEAALVTPDPGAAAGLVATRRRAPRPARPARGPGAGGPVRGAPRPAARWLTGQDREPADGGRPLPPRAPHPGRRIGVALR